VTRHFLKSSFFGMCSILCAYGAKLLYIIIDKIRITVRSADKTVGMAMYFDTGSDLTYLHKDVFDQVLKAVSSPDILYYLSFLRHKLERMHTLVVEILPSTWIAILDARLIQRPFRSAVSVSDIRSTLLCLK
jgi:hypothetical protein